MSYKTSIVCVCGSTKFIDLMDVMAWEFEKQGIIALRVNSLPDWYCEKDGWKESAHGAEHSGIERELDELHLRKIDMSDFIFVVNYHGYVGESTAREIRYAKQKGKRIMFMSTDGENEMSGISMKVEQWYYDFTQKEEERKNVVFEKRKITASTNAWCHDGKFHKVRFQALWDSYLKEKPTGNEFLGLPRDLNKLLYGEGIDSLLYQPLSELQPEKMYEVSISVKQIS